MDLRNTPGIHFACPLYRSRPCSAACRGFSLVELMLVLLLLGLSSLIVLPNIDRGLRDQSVKRSALGLAAAARELRSRALDQGVPHLLLLNLTDHTYRVARGGEIQLPSNVKFADVEGGDPIDSGARQFVFFPNGSVLGGRIDLSAGPDSLSYSVRLEPLTGKIEVLRGGAS